MAHRHAWYLPPAAMEDGDPTERCRLCGVSRDATRSRRGRSNRRRGNDWERALATQLGGRRVGQYGEPADVLTPLFVVQAKVRKAFPSWMTRELDRLPRTDGRIPLLVVSDSSGAGHRRRSIVVVDLRDWVDLHGVER